MPDSPRACTANYKRPTTWAGPLRRTVSHLNSWKRLSLRLAAKKSRPTMHYEDTTSRTAEKKDRMQEVARASGCPRRAVIGTRPGVARAPNAVRTSSRHDTVTRYLTLGYPYEKLSSLDYSPGPCYGDDLNSVTFSRLSCMPWCHLDSLGNRRRKRWSFLLVITCPCLQFVSEERWFGELRGGGVVLEARGHGRSYAPARCTDQVTFGIK